MKQYLLSVCYPAGGTQPPPDALQRIMRDVHAVQKRNAGRRRMGLQRRPARRRIPRPCCATRAARCHHRWSVHREQGADRRHHRSQGTRSRRGARAGAASSRAPSARRSKCARSWRGTERTRSKRSSAREYGRAVAVLSRFLGDIGLAEEAVQDAFTIALTHGHVTAYRPRPPAGSSPLRAIARSITCAAKRAAMSASALPCSCFEQEAEEEHDVRDDRLRLIFTCCHPALGARGAARADASSVRRPHHGGDRARIPGARSHHGAAPVAREGQDPRRRNSVSRARSVPNCPRACAACSPSCISSSTRATARQRVKRWFAPSCAMRQSVSVGCWSNCCRRNPKRWACWR